MITTKSNINPGVRPANKFLKLKPFSEVKASCNEIEIIQNKVPTVAATIGIYAGATGRVVP